MTFTYIDLFAGIGAFPLALNPMGGECVFACENDVYARLTYEANHDIDHPFAWDIREVDSVPHCDIMCAGFPCQPFSVAGRKRGLGDNRGQLYREIVRLAKDSRPRALFLENVRGLLSMKTPEGEKVLDIIKADFAEIGYTLRDYYTDAREWGVPQSRRRVFLIALENGERIVPPLPTSPLQMPGQHYTAHLRGFPTLSMILRETGQIGDDEIVVNKYKPAEERKTSKTLRAAMSGSGEQRKGEPNAKREWPLELSVANTIRSGRHGVSGGSLGADDRHNYDKYNVERKTAFTLRSHTSGGRVSEGRVDTQEGRGDGIYPVERKVAHTLGGAQGGAGQNPDRSQGRARGCYHTSAPRVVRINEDSAKLIMGFPRSFDLSRVAKTRRIPQLGNSVVPQCVEPYARAIKAALYVR